MKAKIRKILRCMGIGAAATLLLYVVTFVLGVLTLGVPIFRYAFFAIVETLRALISWPSDVVFAIVAKTGLLTAYGHGPEAIGYRMEAAIILFPAAALINGYGILCVRRALKYVVQLLRGGDAGPDDAPALRLVIKAFAWHAVCLFALLLWLRQFRSLLISESFCMSLPGVSRMALRVISLPVFLVTPIVVLVFWLEANACSVLRPREGRPMGERVLKMVSIGLPVIVGLFALFLAWGRIFGGRSPVDF